MSEGHGVINSRTLMTPQAPGRNVSESEWDRIFKQRPGETMEEFRERRGAPVPTDLPADDCCVRELPYIDSVMRRTGRVIDISPIHGLVAPPSGRLVQESDVLRMRIG